MTSKDLKSIRSFLGYTAAYEQRNLTGGEAKELKRLLRAVNKALKS